MVTQWVNEVVSFDNWVKNTTVYENLRVFRAKLPRKNVHPSKWAIIISYPSCENIPSDISRLLMAYKIANGDSKKITQMGSVQNRQRHSTKNLLVLFLQLGFQIMIIPNAYINVLGRIASFFSSTKGCFFSVFKDIRLLAMRSAISWICGKVSWKTWNWVWDIWDMYKKHISICIFWDLTSKFCVLMVYFMQ
jgi:hypothetical protein